MNFFKKQQYKTPLQLLNEKIGITKKEFIDNEAIRHGVKYEAEAIDMYCKLLNRSSYDIGLVPFNAFRNEDTLSPSMDCSFLAGSVDSVTIGKDPDSINILEVKFLYLEESSMERFLIITTLKFK